MSKNNPSRVISNILKRFSEIFSRKSSQVVPEISDSVNTARSSQKGFQTTQKRNKITPFTDEDAELSASQIKKTFSLGKKRPSPIHTKMRTSLLFQSYRRYHTNGEENYEDNDGIVNYKDREDKADLLTQLQQIIAKDDNEEDYKLAKLMKNDEEDAQNEMGIVDLYEREAEKFEKLALDHSCLFVQKKSPFELLELYADDRPFLELRKNLLYIKILISYYCRIVVQHRFFRHFIFIVIFWNSIIMTLEDPGKDVQESYFTDMENFCLAVYTIEMILKIFGTGFIFAKNSYLRDPWNVFDFFITLASYIPVFAFSNLSSFKFSSFRIFRILRPLRAIYSIQSLKFIFLTLVSALPLLLDILLILGLFFWGFAIVGTHLFSDLLKNRCFNPESGIISSSKENLCGYSECEGEFICGKMIDNPYYDVMNFDNILYSSLMVFQCITMQAWTVTMFSVARVFNPFSEIYFTLIVLFGSFFLLNLTLAVIKTKFTDVQRVNMKKTEEINKREPIEGDICVGELKRFKRIERSHFRRTNKKNLEGIGASKENNRKMNELTWEDLFALKEMIKEEKEREEADLIFRQTRDENLQDEEKVQYYFKKRQEQKKKSFTTYLVRLSLQKKQELPRKSTDLKLRESYGIQGLQPPIKHLALDERDDIDEILKISEMKVTSNSSKIYSDIEDLTIDQLKANPKRDKLEKSPEVKAPIDIFKDSKNIKKSIMIRNSVLLLPNIKEESYSDFSNSLSLSAEIKSPKSSIMNDSDFNNSFTLKKCKLFELKETQKSENLLPLKPTPINFQENQMPQSSLKIIQETPLFSPTTIGNNPISHNITIPSIPSDGNTLNTLVVRKSILKNPLQGKFSPREEKDSNKPLNIKLELVDTIEKKNNNNKSLTEKADKHSKKKEKMRENVRNFKLMVDRFTDIVSYSKDDVLEYR